MNFIDITDLYNIAVWGQAKFKMPRFEDGADFDVELRTAFEYLWCHTIMCIKSFHLLGILPT
jgi:hypothetical protein